MQSYSVADAANMAHGKSTSVKVGLALIPIVFFVTRSIAQTFVIVVAHMILHSVM